MSRPAPRRHAEVPAAAPAPGAGAARATLGGIVLVLATVAIVHGPVLGARALSFDDDDFVTRNALVTHPSWDSARRFFLEVLDPSSVQGYYAPLTMTSLMLDYAMGGRPEDLRAFHRTSLALHLASVALVVLILLRLGGAPSAALAAGLLFGLHPLTVEPVAWVAARKTVLAACLAFASILCWLEHRRGGGRAWRIASVALHALALLAKPTVVTLPLLLLVLDFWPLRRLDRRAVIEKWPFLLLSLASAVIASLSLSRTTRVVEWPHTDPFRVALQVCWLLAFYLKKIVWPGELSCVYSPPASWSLGEPVVLLSVAVALVLALGVALAAKRTRAPLAGAAFFVLALAPTFGVLRWSRNIAYDNYVYLPALGLLLPLAAGLARVGRGGGARRAALVALVLAAAIAEALGTRAALAHWKDSPTLWRHAVAMAPGEAAAHNALGSTLARQSDHEGAIREFHRATELDPGYADGWSNLGAALTAAGRAADALEPLRRASELGPRDPAAAYALGVAALRVGRLDDAETHLRRAIALRPSYTEAADRLASVLALTGRADQGVEMLRRSIRLDPANAHPRLGLALVLLQLGGHGKEASELLRDATRLQPEWAEPWNERAWLLATTPDPALRDTAEALRLAARAVELTHGRDAATLDTRAAAEAAAGRFDQAAATARAALAVAQGAPADTLAAAIRARLAHYERGVAFVDSTAR